MTLDGSTANISGTPDTAQSATFAIQVEDAKGQTAVQSYTLNINSTGLAQLQSIAGQVPAGTVEIQGVSAGPFNPLSWQEDTLNWVPDVRMPMLSALAGAFQNIYSPWPLEQASGWLLFYGGWDGSSTSNDRVYQVPSPDFLSFGDRILVIDHGAFLHVNNENVVQLPDGSMHMICTTTVDLSSNDKPTYFSSPDGSIWNGLLRILGRPELKPRRSAAPDEMGAQRIFIDGVGLLTPAPGGSNLLLRPFRQNRPKVGQTENYPETGFWENGGSFPRSRLLTRVVESSSLDATSGLPVIWK
jgi:hypothetical protein